MQTSRHLVHVFPTFAVGGAQIRFSQLAAAHGDRYHHTIIALDGILDTVSLLSKQIVVKVVVPNFDKASGVRTLIRCRGILNELKPGMLITYNWGAMDWALANRCAPLAGHVHIEDGFGREENSRQFRRRVWLRRVALSGSHTRVIVPSQQLERIAKDVWRLSSSATQYIPNGIDCSRFIHAASGRHRRSGPITVGTIATLRPEKNLARLIRAFAVVAANLPDDMLRLVIVGDGPERQNLEAAARASGRGKQILFVGPTKTPHLSLAEFDVFALSSDTEQMPLSVLEAMAAHLPVVSFAVGDLQNMVSEENRCFVSTPLDDEESYHRCLHTLIFSRELRERLGAANQTRVQERFEQRLMVTRYAQLFG